MMVNWLTKGKDGRKKNLIYRQREEGEMKEGGMKRRRGRDGGE